MKNQADNKFMSKPSNKYFNWRSELTSTYRAPGWSRAIKKSSEGERFLQTPSGDGSDGRTIVNCIFSQPIPSCKLRIFNLKTNIHKLVKTNNLPFNNLYLRRFISYDDTVMHTLCQTLNSEYKLCMFTSPNKSIACPRMVPGCSWKFSGLNVTLKYTSSEQL